ncbi:MAG: HlyD family efflux transporter periplasmic adaptor subunit, partial [Clostridia bacterium]|nr:HlyD family efflux transporter periplasmic adaptor subunit [Clostridia bacterium]
ERHLTLLDDTLNDFRNQVVTKQIATGNNIDFKSRLESLQVKYDNLSKKSTKHTDVVSKSSGYYIGYADGYENVVNFDEISKISIDDIRKALETEPKEVPSGVIGKVVTEFTWYFLSVLETEKVGSLKVGKTVTVVLPFSAVNTIQAKVYAMNENKETGEVALVLACDIMNQDVASLRIENAQIVTSSYTGIKVPAASIRVNDDGEKGVFVMSGNIAKFKKINIVYTEDDYILSKAEDGADGYVSLYDNIITGGKDLYDGKVIK